MKGPCVCVGKIPLERRRGRIAVRRCTPEEACRRSRSRADGWQKPLRSKGVRTGEKGVQPDYAGGGTGLPRRLTVAYLGGVCGLSRRQGQRPGGDSIRFLTH
ncbi:protein of unknown function [Pararobbsia alpina]